MRFLAVIGGGAIAAALLAAPAFAGTISAPTGNPFAWPGDASGNPTYQDVSFAGFTPGQNVFVEQCDGTDPATFPGWDAAEHCDAVTSPTQVQANGSGAGTFFASSTNNRFRPVKGESPQSLFICLSPNDPVPPNPNALPVYRNCKVRVASNPVSNTADQAFLNITLPDAAGPPPDVPEVPIAVILPLGAIAVGGGVLFMRKRRASANAAA